MISFPCAKINLGLNIVSKRADGYHNLETVFYPISFLHDTLEVKKIEDKTTNSVCHLTVSGTPLIGNSNDNLVVKAYNLLSKDFSLPPLQAILHKEIPSQAGLGGGSSDAAEMLKIINKECNLKLSIPQLKQYATLLGADCAFFIEQEPAFATGIGEELEIIKDLKSILKNYFLVLIKPEVAVSTAQAFKRITPKQPEVCCKDVIFQPIETWKEKLLNDFEKPIFSMAPELKDIKDTLYKTGAIYASMSGSGSTVFGLYTESPNENHKKLFPNMFYKKHQL